MNPVVIIIALGGVGIALMLVWMPLKRKLDLDKLTANCATLRSQLGILRTQGGSTDAQQKLQAELDDCQDAMRAAGIDVSEFGELVRQIDDIRRQMNQEFGHYRSTDWVDLTKRGNTIGTIWRLGEEQQVVYRAGIAMASGDLEKLGLLFRGVKLDIAASISRVRCWRSGSGGCGENEGRRRAERERITTPLAQIKSTIRAALGEAGEVAPVRNEEQEAEYRANLDRLNKLTGMVP